MSSKAIVMPQTETPSDREPYVTLAEAAKHLSISVRTLQRRIERKEIPAYRYGAGLRAPVRVKLSELEPMIVPIGSLAR